MPKLRTLLVDDEPLALNLMNSIVSQIDEIEIIGQCKNGREAIQSTIELSPDLIFLDIQMPGVNGFEVVKRLQSDTMPMVIFATACNQYAIDAFDLHAVDYLLKPFDTGRVKRAVQRAVERSQSQKDGLKAPLIGAINEIAAGASKDASFADIADTEQLPESMKRKLLIRDAGIITVIPFDDIDWIDAAGDYMCVHALGETHIMRITMVELLSKLDEKQFVRIHRSTVVNIDRVTSTSLTQSRGNLLHLPGGHTLKVSRTYRESTRKYFQ